MSDGRWLTRHGLVLASVIVYATVAPAALFALPLAALLALSPVRSVKEAVTLAVAGGFSLAWLAQVGELPDQVIRAATLLTAAVFVLTTRYFTVPVTHRAVVAVGVATLAVGGLLFALGSSWAELRWWVAHETSRSTRLISQLLWMAAQDGSSAAGEMAALLGETIQYAADYFPAILALQLTAGLAISTAIYVRVAETPHGPGLGRLADFRFSHYFGWLAIPPLVVLLLPSLEPAQLAALNVLIVMGALYALRGVAVVVFGLHLLGAATGFIAAVVIFGAFLILPVAVAGAILLGVVDSGMDLRRRWISPPAS